MLKEETKNIMENLINPFYKGVCKMKPLRIFVIVALMVLPLFASSVLADFTADTVNIGFAGNKKISANTINQPILGFWVPKVGDDTLKTLVLKSYIERAFSVGSVKLYVESNPTPGFQTTDTYLGAVNTLAKRFETQDTIVFSGLNRVIKAGRDTFYIVIDAHTDSVRAHPDLFSEHGLDVVIEPGRIKLGLTSGNVNLNRLNNLGYNVGPPPYFDPFKLIFDTQGPQFDLHFCIEDNTCSTYTYYGSGWSRLLNVDHEDSVRICATKVGGGTLVGTDILGDITVFGWVHLTGNVTTERMFGVPNVKLRCPDVDEYGCGGGDKDGCDTCYTTGFRIPNVNNSTYRGVDADSGHWAIGAWAVDSAGNRDTMYLEHDDLPYRIDTQDPNIDEISWEFVTDLPPIGKINLGDCIMIVAEGPSNPIDPVKECVQMRVDTSWMAGHTNTYPAGEWAAMSDTLQENNRIFRRVFCLTTPLPIDSSNGCPVSFLVEAWDNACNSDTMTSKICADMDLDPPTLDVTYEWHTDYDTMWACLGIGDKALIRANVGGDDIVSVTAMMDSAGIDSLMRHALSLPNRGGGVWDTVWKITEPPILFGKDIDNTQPPANDGLYDIWLTACDDGGNCVSANGVLNKTLDTRRPRPIGYSQFCPDSVPCALTASSLAGGIIELKWDTACDESDAYYYYVWASFEGAPFESIGATSVAEQTPGSKYYKWHSEPLAEGYWEFKIKTEDNCSNIGPFSCVVGAFADATPPHVCIALPDSGMTFGSPFEVKAVADSESHDVASACLWYRLRSDIENPTQDPGQWKQCLSNPCMYRPGSGYVFTDTVSCLRDELYTGWVEMAPLACDLVGNCQDTSELWDDACLVLNDDFFRKGHFLIYWDTLAPTVKVVSVNGFPSPIICQDGKLGYDVTADSLNRVIFNVEGAIPGVDLFTIDVRALYDITSKRIVFDEHVTMPCTVWVDVWHWEQGTKNLYIHVTNETNLKSGSLKVQLCVPAWRTPCMKIVAPVEWQRIPCSKVDGYLCVPIWAQKDSNCIDVLVTEVKFQWSPNDTVWYDIVDTINYSSGPGGHDTWKICWKTPLDSTWNDKDIFLRAIGYTQYYTSDTSLPVKVYVDCQTPRVKLLIEDVLWMGCDSTSRLPKVSGNITFKAVVLDTTVDISEVSFWYKLHDTVDLPYFWTKIGNGHPASNQNIWVYENWSTTSSSLQNHFVDFRVIAKDAAGHMMFDFDGDGKFDDNTFLAALADSSGWMVFVDNEAPQPAICMVADSLAPIYNINPSTLFSGSSGQAYVKAHDPITTWICTLPSEDSCEVYKVEYWVGQQARIDTIYTCTDSTKDSTWIVFGTGHYEYWWTCSDSHAVALDTSYYPGNPGDGIVDTLWYHVSTGTDPMHFPITFNPWELPEFIEHYLLEDGWWEGALRAVLYDSLENSKMDQIKLYILDVDPSQALIVQPQNDDYIWGDVAISVQALNAYDICKVEYYYKYNHPDSAWYPILNGVSESSPYFEISWHTQLVADGYYCLKARAMDCSNNWDESPRTICVHVANCQPIATIEDPRICERTCPDDTVDTLGFVAGSKYVTLYATASSECDQVTEVEFYVKNIFEYPSEYTLVGTDYFPTNGKYSVKWMSDFYSDGRYHVMARVHTKAGRYNDSAPVEVVLDQSAPYTQIISIDGNHYPDGMDITTGDVISIELVAIDSTSNDGWTRCYNSGLKSISVCMENCSTGVEITKCFEVNPAEDGIHTVRWNTSGLEFEGCSGCYHLYVIATDCLDNVDTSEVITVYVSDVTAPITTIGGFDGNYVYGYSDEKLKNLLFEYADSGSSDWIPIGYSDTLRICSFQQSVSCQSCTYYLYKTSWNPASLIDGNYQIRVISHDTCSNQADSLAPYAFFSVEGGTITPYNPDILGAVSFEKNWCVGGMHGIVRQTSSQGTPVVFGRYNTTYECIEMQHPQDPTNNNYAGSFFASDIESGGPAMFFSSVTAIPTTPPATGEPYSVTYLRQGSFDVVQVKRDLGTHGTYQDGCVKITIPAGAVGSTFQYDRYLWVSPREMPWVPYTQPDINPIGDNNGYATYVAFTDCHYCCGWYGDNFGWDVGSAQKSPSDQSDDCCFNPGASFYAKIKLCYDTTITTDKEHLAVMWWDCDDGEFKSDNIYYPPTVAGFNTTDHTVEFATTCLSGPFAVVEIKERLCEGSIVVSVRKQDITPYVINKGVEYTGPKPKFTGLITDNVQGTDAINQSSICFQIGDRRIYDGSKSSCSVWARGFGNFEYAGYDLVSGLFRAGWSVNNSNYDCYDDEHRFPAPGLSAGDHIAILTAQNDNIQTCNDTVRFKVDATAPYVRFPNGWVGRHPVIKAIIGDTESGVNKDSIFVDFFGDRTNYDNPAYHTCIAQMKPDEVKDYFIDDTTLIITTTFNLNWGPEIGFLHVWINDGSTNSTGYWCTDYHKGGVLDRVGNQMDAYWQYFPVDYTGPSIVLRSSSDCIRPLIFEIRDDESGLSPTIPIQIFEDSSLVTVDTTFTRDPHNPLWWNYYPNAGKHRLDIVAYDSVGNRTNYTYNIKPDCLGPTVSFVPSFISCKTPTVKVVITDPSGVKWDSLKVDLYTSDWVLQTFEQGMYTRNGNTITVVGDGDQFGLSDGSTMYAVVYTEKTGATSYSRGPEDSVGNATASQWYKKAYYTDCVGPVITWKYGSSTAYPKECERPVKLQVTDAKSGVATVMLYEDKVDKTSLLVYNSSANWWEYTPTAGKHTLDVVATDSMSNSTTYTFDVKDDCLGPAVAFNAGFVTKNPTIKFKVSDPSGVDWNTVNARVYGCGKECIYLAPELKNHVNMTTGEVTLTDCILDCSDGSVVDVYVYSGTSYTGSGPADLLGNYAPNYYRCSYEVDAGLPSIWYTSLSERPIQICFSDSKSGIDWSTLEFYEDSLLICEGLACIDTNVNLDTAKACMAYEPGAGRKLVEIRVKDFAGNLKIYSFYTEEMVLYFTDPHNYPNPFDPREGNTTISLGLSKAAYVTAKIYDFSGEFVTELQQNKYTGTSTKLYWGGKTDNGTDLANGTYLCYILARDDAGATKTAVIKITVKKEDK